MLLKSSSDNVRVPNSAISGILYGNDTKCLVHLEKINPLEDWGSITIEITSKVKVAKAKANSYATTDSATDPSNKYFYFTAD